MGCRNITEKELDYIMNDYFYRSMSDNQLQAICQQISWNLEQDPSDGMKKELALARGVAEERGLKLGNKFDSVKGFIEFELNKKER